MTVTGPRMTQVAVADGIATIVLDRPPLNVLTIASLHELDRDLLGLEGIHDLRLVILRGAGRVFSAGVDVSEHVGELLVPMLDAFEHLSRHLVEYPVPTLAVVHGAALGGGCEIATLCDLTLVADDAKIGTPEIALGVVPPVGAAVFPALAGRQRAAALVLLGTPISGREAADWGIVWRSVPPSELEAEALRVADAFRARSAASLRLAKRTLRIAAEAASPGDAIEAADAEQRRSLPGIVDADEGLRAFSEKRSPRWQHR